MTRIALAALLATVPALAADAVVEVDSFKVSSSTGVPGWEQFAFKKGRKPTEYSLGKEGDNAFVRAVSKASGTSFIKRLTVDLKECPVLSWRWKVDAVIEKADAHRKEGDDYAARVYVGFKYQPAQAKGWEKFKYGVFKSGKGFYPPQAILFYVWDNKHEIGTNFENPFSDKGWMIVMESGDSKAGQWVTERRNVYEDYKKFFGGEPPEVEFVALMTDTDNTGTEAAASYDDIQFQKP